MPFFSIIIPVYNVVPFLRECLDSVRKQTFADWECICVDDGSTDGSSEIIDEYKKLDDRFIVFHQSNSGVSSARNLGLDNCSGEWICFLDSDDLILNDYLNEIRKLIDKNDKLNWVAVAYSYLLDDGSIVQVHHNGKDEKIIIGESAKDRTMDCVAKCGAICSAIIRKDVLSGLRFDTGVRMREDTLFLTEASNNVRGLAITPINSYLYRKRSDSAYHSAQSLDDALIFQKKFNQIWKKHRFSTKAYTLFTMKNLQFCLRSCRIDVDKLRQIRHEINCGTGECAFDYSSLKFRAKLRWWVFLKLGYWKTLLGFKKFNVK